MSTVPSSKPKSDEKKPFLVTQAKLVALSFVLFIAAVLTTAIANNSVNGSTFISMLMIFIQGVIVVYVMNCIVVGSCNLYAWVVAYFLVVVALVGIVVRILNLSNKGRKN